jgi:HEPN domain-containing protein
MDFFLKLTVSLWAVGFEMPIREGFYRWPMCMASQSVGKVVHGHACALGSKRPKTAS